MKDNVNKRNLEIKTLLVFLITFVLAAGLTDYQNQTQEKEEKSKAAYTAESTITHIEAQLNKYLAESNLIKQIVESGRDIDTQQFATISELMQDKQHVIKAHELAPDGVISYVYPLESNEAAIGLDMLENKERKKKLTLLKKPENIPLQDLMNLYKVAPVHCFLIQSTQMIQPEKKFSGDFRFLSLTGISSWKKFS